MNFMAPVTTPEAERYLEALAAELEVDPARYESADRSYTSLGNWLHRPDSTVQYDRQVYVQGSFRLGTAIRPLNDEEEYDVDAVCEFKALTKSSMTQKDLKDKLGVEIKAYARSKKHGQAGHTRPPLLDIAVRGWRPVPDGNRPGSSERQRLAGAVGISPHDQLVDKHGDCHHRQRGRQLQPDHG